MADALDIKFKGRRTDNGEWVEGYLFRIWDKAYILWGTTNDIPNMVEVDPATVEIVTPLYKAAEDMYEALLEAVHWLMETPEGKSVPQVNGQPGKWLHMAIAAIEKAEGRQ